MKVKDLSPGGYYRLTVKPLGWEGAQCLWGRVIDHEYGNRRCQGQKYFVCFINVDGQTRRVSFGGGTEVVPK